MKQTLTVLLAGALLAAALSGCTLLEEPPAQGGADNEAFSPQIVPETGDAFPGERTLYLCAPEGMDDRFPHVWDGAGGFPQALLFGTLLTAEADGSLAVGLAEEWEVSPDGLLYTLTLRRGLTWHDGEPLTGEDVLWSLGAVLRREEAAALYRSAFLTIEGAAAFAAGTSGVIAGAETEGQVLRFRLTEPCPTFLQVLAQWQPLPRHLLGGTEPVPEEDFWACPVGSGPWRFDGFDGARARLSPFEDWYGGGPGEIASVTLLPLDADELAAQTVRDELDYFTTLSAPLAQEVLRNSHYRAETAGMCYERRLLFNLSADSRVREPAVRQALAYAIDREALCAEHFDGEAAPLTTSLRPTDEFFCDETAVYPPDAAKARRLLREAGWDFEAPLRIACRYDDRESLAVTATLTEQLAAAGVQAEVYLLESDAALLSGAGFDCLYTGTSARTPEELYGAFSSQSPLAALRGGENGAFDEALAALGRARSAQVRGEALAALQKLEAERLWELPLFAVTGYVLINEARIVTAGAPGDEWSNYDRRLSEWRWADG